MALQIIQNPVTKRRTNYKDIFWGYFMGFGCALFAICVWLVHIHNLVELHLCAENRLQNGGKLNKY